MIEWSLSFFQRSLHAFSACLPHFINPWIPPTDLAALRKTSIISLFTSNFLSSASLNVWNMWSSHGGKAWDVAITNQNWSSQWCSDLTRFFFSSGSQVCHSMPHCWQCFLRECNVPGLGFHSLRRAWVSIFWPKELYWTSLVLERKNIATLCWFPLSLAGSNVPSIPLHWRRRKASPSSSKHCKRVSLTSDRGWIASKIFHTVPLCGAKSHD